MAIMIPKKAGQEELMQLRVVLKELERIWHEAGFGGLPFVVQEEEDEMALLSVILFEHIEECRAEFYFRSDSVVDFLSFRNGEKNRIELPAWNEGIASLVESLNYYLLLKISACYRCKDEFSFLIGDTSTSQRFAVSTDMADKILTTTATFNQ